jgi:hypothetical protein
VNNFADPLVRSPATQPTQGAGPSSGTRSQATAAAEEEPTETPDEHIIPLEYRKKFPELSDYGKLRTEINDNYQIQLEPLAWNVENLFPPPFEDMKKEDGKHLCLVLCIYCKHEFSQIS